MTKRVLVLMSTYNAEKFLIKQIESIKAQVGVEVDIFCRDDGSTDNTILLLKSHAIEFYQGENLGPANSFMNLIEKCPNDYDFYAFCDQDDYWYPEKLKNATERLSEDLKLPQLYYSAVNVTDENLNILYRSFKMIPDSFSELVFSCGIMQGCTQVFNKELLMVLREHKARDIAMHDYYITMLCKYVGGKIIADSEPQISYRQHATNTLGIKAKHKARFTNQYSKTVGFISVYNEMCRLPHNEIEFIDEMVAYSKKHRAGLSLISEALKTHYTMKWKITLIKNLFLGRF